MRRRSRVGHPRTVIKSVGFMFHLYKSFFKTILAAQCCTFSRLLTCERVWGFHMGMSTRVLAGLVCCRLFL